MSDNDKKPAYRIGIGDNAVFALTDVRIAPLNPDGTYGESVPLPTASRLVFIPHSNDDKNISFDVTDLSYTLTFSGYTAFKSYSRKVLHAIARRRARAMARQRGAR